MLVRNSAFHALLAYEESQHFGETSLMFKQHGTSERKKKPKAKDK